jgi:hypothetical protein
MPIDTIVDEIHQIRAQLLSEHGGDFSAYFASLLQKQRQSPERYVRFTDPSEKLLSDKPELPLPPVG